MKLQYTTDTSAPTNPEEWARTDETLIRPVSPGAALARLCEVGGALQRHPEIARLLPAETARQLKTQRQALENALEADNREALSTALNGAQSTLYHLYAELCGPLLKGEEADAASERLTRLQALRFPDPRQIEVQPVDISTVIPTYAIIRTQAGGHQVVTTLHFTEAHNATAYWLHEVRYFGDGERVEDPLVESLVPLFARVRLALGPRHLRIKSRNPRTSVLSAEFTIEVPDLR